jgi:hypothetical protein
MAARFRSLLWITAFAGPLLAASPREEVLGTWRGTSTCVNKEKHPACKDEVVIYEIRPSKTAAEGIEVSADKVVNGERGTMGVLEFTYDARRKAWTSELTTRRGERALWILPVVGKRIDGELVDLPDGGRVRVVAVKKD